MPEGQQQNGKETKTYCILLNKGFWHALAESNLVYERLNLGAEVKSVELE